MPKYIAHFHSGSRLMVGGPFTDDTDTIAPDCYALDVSSVYDALLANRQLGERFIDKNGTVSLATEPEIFATLSVAGKLAVLKKQMPVPMRAKLYATGMQAAFDAEDFEALARMVHDYSPANDEESAFKSGALALFPNPTATPGSS